MAFVPAHGDPRYRAPVASQSALPLVGQPNEIRMAGDTGTLFYWDGVSWQPIKATALPATLPDVSGNVQLAIACDASVYLGAAVRIQAGIAVNGLADSLTNSNIIGIVEYKASSTVCNIRSLGVTEGVYSGLDITKDYFLSDSVPGEITTTVPTAAGSVVLKMGQAYSATKFLVSMGLRMVRS